MTSAIAAHPDFLGLFATVMPRAGGEFSYNFVKIAAVLAAYFGWLWTMQWIDKDCRRVSFSRELWGFVNLGCCGLALLTFVAIPNFAFCFVLLLLLYGSPTFIYVSRRNEVVPPQMKVLTPEHISALLSGKKAVAQGDGKKKKGGSQADIETPGGLHFVAKNATKDEVDESRMSKALESPGYKAALELVKDAIENRATDIHMEPTREEMTVRFRVDSIMNSVPSFGRQRGDSVINVFKVLAGLDITEKRQAQDGSFSAEFDGRKIDFRVATAGSVNGQKMVIRILDASRQVTTLTSLGLRPALKEKLGAICQQSYGMLITCGPTGAGKTSTLYACLGEIDRFQRNVITLENPVEYQMDNVTQIEVNPKAGKTFASELRSILRQDPDVILVGEVRDAETAEIACQAAQTGHMVFTTLHANDAVTSVGRLIDLGVKPFMIASALSAVLGQRLVRTLCAKCKVAYTPGEELLKKLKIKPPAEKKLTFYKATVAETPDVMEGEEVPEVEKCPKCKGTGYLGRTGIFELLTINDEMKELIRANPDLVAIRQAAVKGGGFVTLFDDGIRKVVEGKTSLEEIQRVAK